MYDRIIYGGVIPVGKTITLGLSILSRPSTSSSAASSVLSTPVATVSSPLTASGTSFTSKTLSMRRPGNKVITFASKDATKPAKFYINSTPAYKAYKTQLITIDGRKGSIKANVIKAGKMESNDRVINRLS